MERVEVLWRLFLYHGTQEEWMINVFKVLKKKLMGRRKKRRFTAKIWLLN